MISRRKFMQNTALLSAGALLAAKGAHAQSTRVDSALSYQEYLSYDGLGLAGLVRSKDVSPIELLEMAIARTEAVNPTINAVVLKHYEEARRGIKEHLSDGPFRGVPFLLKDLGISMAGTVTTEGSVFFQEQRFNSDSTLVERYRRAGLVIFGKTHSPEFGSSASTESRLFGVTRNPWDLERSAGGSSGGSAAAVAAGIIPAAHASDGGGSIRMPASACGLFGLKPSRGRVPMGPDAYETRDGLSAVNVISRSVRDSAALLDISQGSAVGDAYATPARERPYLEEVGRAPGKLRIALMREPLLPVLVADDCIAAVNHAAQLCESLGHHMEEIQLPIDAMKVWEAMGMMSNVLVASKVKAREQVLRRKLKDNELEPINLIMREAGLKIDAVTHSEARHTMHQASRVMGQVMQQYDLILSPTMAIVPAALGVLSLDQDMGSFIGPASAASSFTALHNVTGQPAMSIPLYWNAQGLPIGVMFAGRYGDEATLFRLAAQLEEALPWFERLSENARKTKLV